MADYFPPAEKDGTWRLAAKAQQKANDLGFNPEKLAQARHYQYFLNSGDSFGVVIIRNGWMVDEYYTENVLPGTTFDIWSCTKSFTSMGIALLLEEYSDQLTYQTRVYDHLPQDLAPQDSLRLHITLEQLLDMASGLRGSGSGAIGMGVPYGDGEFEYALGFTKNRLGLSCDVVRDPGTSFDYSDANYSLLSLFFEKLLNEELGAFITRKVLTPMGISNFHWDPQGGSGKIGPHTNGHTGIHISVRDLARIGYLLLLRGVWGKEKLLPDMFFNQLFTSNTINVEYRNGFWNNYEGKYIPKVPEDTFYMKGYRSNRCYVIPSLNLVVARCGTGPAQWDERKLLGDIVGSIID